MVRAATREKLRVRAAFDHASGLEHQYEVGVHDGRQAVRNDEYRTATEQAVDRFLHEALGLGIER